MFPSGNPGMIQQCPLWSNRKQLPMTSPQQLTANRANAEKSTGPTSPEGKAKVSHNALKTGLTGRTVLLPSDDVAAYQAHIERVFAQYSPQADDEKRLTQFIADALWRLERIPSLEAGIYAIGRRELASQFADEPDETVRKAMIEAQIFLTYRRDLNNLSIQELRLRRQYEKDEGELKRLIADRRAAAEKQQQAEKLRWYQAMQHYSLAQEMGLRFDPAEIGFEFSTEELIAHEQQEQIKAVIRNGRYYEFKKKGLIKLPKKAA
jgi:hypothetical protein